ncbi:MAG: ATP-binding protein [Desulfobacteraceae bacterium]|nr:ATP-binding protein [Desulfobacteraceae bacterium]
MIVEETMEKLRLMKFNGMISAFEQQMSQPEMAALSFEDRFGMLLDAEWSYRENRKLHNRLRRASFRIQEASVEQIDYQIPRKLKKAVVLRLTNSDWVAKHQNLIITGPTGIGKSYLACALAQKACRDGYTAFYTRLSRVLYELSICRADGSYGAKLQKLAKIQILILDDWGLTDLKSQERHDLLELLEDRHNVSSTIITSQLPISKWYDNIGDPTMADAICDRVIHNAHKIELDGDSVRKKKGKVD